MTIPIENKTKFDALWNLLLESALSGVRIYYSEPTIEYDLHLHQNIATVFRVRQRIGFAALEDLKNLETPNGQPVRMGDMEIESYLHRFCKEIKSESWRTSKQSFSSRFKYMWPASPFEEWLEGEHDSHWITANWYAPETENVVSETYYVNSDYAIILSVKAPLTCSVQEYQDRYGSAFVLTKLST